jgi:hypothetical protein
MARPLWAAAAALRTNTRQGIDIFSGRGMMSPLRLAWARLRRRRSISRGRSLPVGAHRCAPTVKGGQPSAPTPKGDRAPMAQSIGSYRVMSVTATRAS